MTMRIVNNFNAVLGNSLPTSTPIARSASPLSSYARQSAPRFSAPAFLFTVASAFGCELQNPIQRFDARLDASTDQPTMAQDQLKVDALVTDHVPTEAALVESGVDASMADHVPTEIGLVDAGVDAGTDVSNDRPIDIGFGDVGQDVPRDMGVDVVDAGEIGVSDVPIPTVLRPSSGILLPPSRVIRSWAGGSSHYRLCETTLGLSAVVDPLCPGEVMGMGNFLVRDPILPGMTTYWKVAGCNSSFTDCTRFSAVSTFTSAAVSLVWHRFDETSGATAIDSGSGTPARLLATLNANVRRGTGIAGFAVEFNNDNGVVTIPDAEGIRFGAGDFTLMAWVHLTAVAAHGQAIFEKITRTDGFEVYVTRDGGFFSFYGAGGCSVESPVRITDSTWHHVAVTRESMAIRLYVDGAQVDTGICSENFTNTVPLSIGCNSGGTCPEPALGLIDDTMAIQGLALSPEAINNNRCSVAVPAAVRLGSPMPPRCP